MNFFLLLNNKRIAKVCVLWKHEKRKLYEIYPPDKINFVCFPIKKKEWKQIFVIENFAWEQTISGMREKTWNFKTHLMPSIDLLNFTVNDFHLTIKGKSYSKCSPHLAMNLIKYMWNIIIHQMLANRFRYL